MANTKVSYLESLREFVGTRKLIAPGVRALVLNEKDQILIIRRRDDGSWAFPAGGLELDESILDCVKREVREEAGLDVLEALPIAIYSEPRFSTVNTHGEALQKLTVVFLIREWQGNLLTETDETVDARFFALDNLPPLAPYHQETIEDLRHYKGQFILK